MAPTRSAHIRFGSILIHGLLCFAVIMQMLGTPTSLWTLDFDADLVEASLLEGLSLPPSHVTIAPILVIRQHLESSMPFPSVLLEHTLFRPPYLQGSPMSLA